MSASCKEIVDSYLPVILDMIKGQMVRDGEEPLFLGHLWSQGSSRSDYNDHDGEFIDNWDFVSRSFYRFNIQNGFGTAGRLACNVQGLGWGSIGNMGTHRIIEGI